MKETDEQHDPLHEQMIRNRRRIAPGHWSNRDIDCLLRVIDGARAVAATCTEGAIKELVAELAKRADNQSERAVFEEATEILLYQACVRAKTLIGFDCRDRIEWGENYNQAFKDVFDRLVVALAAYDATALADALRPFAKAADRIPSVMTDNDSGINVRVGDLRAAAKALAAHDATQDGEG